MKRTHRNLLLIAIVCGAILLAPRWLPPRMGIWVFGAIAVVAALLVFFGRNFLVARYHMRKRAFSDALPLFRRFEQQLTANPLRVLLTPLYFGIYTFNGIALTRNNIGVCLMNQGELDEAEHVLRTALALDPQYAIAFVNLGVIAGLRGDAVEAERHMRKAVE